MKIVTVVGARPQFIKAAVVSRAIAKKSGIDEVIVHTGQHYDNNMSEIFFDEMQIPKPAYNLAVKENLHGAMTAKMLCGIEEVLMNEKPDIVLVYGDTNSTLAASLAASKLKIAIAHIEAGLRSFNMQMPEEINRIVTDSICDHFFTTSKVANEYLLKSGTKENKIHFVGNTMIDTLYQNLEKLSKPGLWDENNLTIKKYFLITLHRPSNVDDPKNLSKIIDIILAETGELPVIFPLHPRTKKNLDKKYRDNKQLIIAEPMGYLEFIFLVKNSKAVITDSGGITEEATVLNIPCITLRNSTERPETITLGSNELAGTHPDNMIPYLKKIKNNEWKKSSVPPLWDGKTSVRIIKKLIELYYRSGSN